MVDFQDVGEGWWEGVNASGKRGLFPEAYVEVSKILFIFFNLVLVLGIVFIAAN